MTSPAPCAHEARVLALHRSGADAVFVREHLATCASCREAVEVAGFMVGMAAMPDPHRLPEASRVWFRAQLVRRWEAERRAAAPIETMQRAERGLLLAGLAVLVWMWTQADRWLGLTDPSSSVSVVSSLLPRGVVIAIVAVAVVAAVGSLALLRDMAKD